MGTEDFVDTPLHEAVRYGDLEEVRSALKQGHDPDQIGIYQWSPLHEAANNGDVEIVDLLLKYDGDPNRKDMLRGCSALHYAASQGQEECLLQLLNAGGRYNEVNADGETCLDVAVGDCRQLLQDCRDQDARVAQRKLSLSLSNCSDSLSINDLGLGSFSNPSTSNYGNQSLESSSHGNRQSESEKDSMFDPDEISMLTTSSGSAQYPHSGAWGSGTVHGTKNELALGHIQLSFEYNSKKSTLNVRVWQLMDLLLPPADTSMIHSIYVKSYLHPDKRKETKRKTEEIRVPKHDQESERRSPDEKFAIFKPSTFSFSHALEYKDITKKMVEERLIVLEVCITQKYTRKSFMVASLNMPLKTAVKKIVKEKYSLKPCISTQIPENMKIYNASEMSISSTTRYHSNPSLLMRQGSKGSWAVPYHGRRRVSSEANLSMVVAEMPVSKTPSIEISVPAEEDEELNEALKQVAVMEDVEMSRSGAGSRSVSRSESKVSSGSTQIDMSWSDVGSLSEMDDLESVSANRTLGVSEIEVHMPNMLDPPSQGSSKNRPTSSKKGSKKKEKKGSFKKEELGSASRPDTPSWDNYVEPLTEPHLLPIDFESELTFDPRAPQLPMATGFDLPGVHRSNSRLSSIHYEDDLTGEESPKVKGRRRDSLIQPEPVHSGFMARSASQPDSSSSDGGKAKAKVTESVRVKRSTSEGNRVKVKRSVEKIQRSVKDESTVNVDANDNDLVFAV